MNAGIEEQALYAKLLGCQKLLKDVKDDLEVLQEIAWNNNNILKAIENACWCVCDARDDINNVIEHYWNENT
jgi:hypothetical protein